ncbi:EAL domain-containing protein [Massilia sp. S19_KUP03_FR1]|uniref:EAL domain-containing protein n=1 Tax=Massilia sp. S19_KUP03_FR1 TaxID=3025503 RepID=UPI002FCD6E83
MTKAGRAPGATAVSQRRLQMADIARLAGVSTATVSRALSNSPLVNEETRSRILDLASSLRYSVNVAAQNLRMKQNRTVGVLIPFERSTRQHLSDPFLLAMLGSLADALTEQGYDMLYFGTGYSSLSHLRRLPIDTLKIDRSFVSKLDSEADKRKIAEVIIMLAHTLGMDVVAEGVETEAELAVLRAMGSDFVQGYVYFRPLSAQLACPGTGDDPILA